MLTTPITTPISSPSQSLVITDLDGTLLPSNGQFHPRDLATLEALGQSRVIRVIATGRSLYSAYIALPLTFPIDYLIFSSGAGILDWHTQQILVAHHLSQPEIANALSVLQAVELDFMLHRPVPDNHYFWYHATGQDNPDFQRRCRRYEAFAIPLTEIDAHTLTHACQFVAVDPISGEKSKYNEIRAQLDTLHVIRSTSPMDGASTWIEIFPCAVSKSRASAWVANRHQIPHVATFALGNDYNDLDLLEWAGASCVVANAPAELQHLYPTVKSTHEAGFTDAVYSWKQLSLSNS